MALLTLLPLGMMQLLAAIEHGYGMRARPIHAAADRQTAGVDARAGRHDLQRRRARLAWFVLRLWVAPKRAAERLPDGAGTADR